MGLNVYGSLTFPFVSVIPDSAGSAWNIYPVPTTGFPDAPTRFMFGTVDGLNYLGTKLTIGQRVMFDSNKAVLVTQADQLYYIMDETEGTIFKENSLPEL